MSNMVLVTIKWLHARNIIVIIKNCKDMGILGDDRVMSAHRIDTQLVSGTKETFVVLFRLPQATMIVDRNPIDDIAIRPQPPTVRQDNEVLKQSVVFDDI